MRSDTRVFDARRCGRVRGAALLLVTVSLTMLLGFAALAIDIGYMYAVHTELQNAADASAMAGASALVSDAALQGSSGQDEVSYQAQARARDWAVRNLAGGVWAQLGGPDFAIGYVLNPYNLGEQLTVAGVPYNAVLVRVRRALDSPNGPVDLLFATIWGKGTASLGATATAYANANMSGYQVNDSKAKRPLVPITVREEMVQQLLQQAETGGGTDQYRLDPATGEVTLGQDGIPEFTIFPIKQKEHGQGDPAGDPSDGAGNFGLLSFATDNSSATTPSDQVENGLTTDEIQQTLGEEEIRFYDDDGSQITHALWGTPGIKNGPIFSAAATRLGDVIGYFVHTQVVASGQNALFTVNNIQFGRVMAVDSSQGHPWLVVQPSMYLGEEIQTSAMAPSHWTARAPMLIR